MAKFNDVRRDPYKDSIPDNATIEKVEDSSPIRNDPTDLSKGQSLFEAFGYKFPYTLVGTGDLETNTEFDSETFCFGEYTPTDADQNRLFNPNNPAHAYINTTDQLAIYMYGIQIRYYKVKLIEDQSTFNPLYGEAPSREYDGATLIRDKHFSYLEEDEPLVLWGIYTSADLSQGLTSYGMDATRTATVQLNIVYARKQLGRDPMIGDVLIPWDVPEQVYEVRSVTPANKTLYMPRRWKLDLELTQWSK